MKKRIQIMCSRILIAILLLSSCFTVSAEEVKTRENVTQENVRSGSTVADVLGMNGEIYMDWLKSHQTDDYYLGTVYRPYDWRSPKGDPSFNGNVGMNCTGFVWHVLRQATSVSGGNTDLIPALSGWVGFYKQYDIQRQYFPTKEEMLALGYLEKGDLIWIFDGSENTVSDYHHLGIYWGDGTSDSWWHSLNGWSMGLGLPYDGNMISEICSASKNPIEQNRCAMACQGCGAVSFLLKSSGITFRNPLLLSYHTKQLN